MRDELDLDLAELYPARHNDELRLERLRGELFGARPKPRFSRRWAGVAVAGMVALALTGSVVALNNRPDVSSGPGTAPQASAVLLDMARYLEETHPMPQGKFEHIRYHVYGTVRGGPKHVFWVGYGIDVYIPAEPGQQVTSTTAIDSVTLYDGAAADLAPFQPSPDQAPVVWQDSCTVTPCVQGTPLLPDEPAALLDAASKTLLSPFASNKKKAEVYRKLATTPGVTYDRGVVTATGSPLRLSLAESTRQPMGVRTYGVGPTGEPTGSDAMYAEVTAREWVDQRP